jgi:hypothetical protein
MEQVQVHTFAPAADLPFQRFSERMVSKAIVHLYTNTLIFSVPTRPPLLAARHLRFIADLWGHSEVVLGNPPSWNSSSNGSLLLYIRISALFSSSFLGPNI